MPSYNTIKVETDGALALITLNRPEKRNAISATMIAELLAALKRCGIRQRARGHHHRSRQGFLRRHGSRRVEVPGDAITRNRISQTREERPDFFAGCGVFPSR